jgi:hypothetical protein
MAFMVCVITALIVTVSNWRAVAEHAHESVGMILSAYVTHSCARYCLYRAEIEHKIFYVKFTSTRKSQTRFRKKNFPKV